MQLPKHMISSTAAADEIGVTTGRIRQMLIKGILVGKKIGRDWWVDERSAKKVAKNEPKVGRPRSGKKSSHAA